MPSNVDVKGLPPRNPHWPTEIKVVALLFVVAVICVSAVVYLYTSPQLIGYTLFQLLLLGTGGLAILLTLEVICYGEFGQGFLFVWMCVVNNIFPQD
jgi:hypothetical protein